MTNHRTGYLAGVAILGLLCACGGDDKSSTDASVAPTESSVTALTDEALVADLAALWSSPVDATEVAAFYAPEAVIHDNVSGETSTGLEAIQATIEKSCGSKCHGREHFGPDPAGQRGRHLPGGG